MGKAKKSLPIWKELFLLLFTRNYLGFILTSGLLFLIECAMTFFIIQKVPYTEIDWSTYMQQVECYTKKKMYNYSEITGSTGPLVYPAGHLMVYSIFHSLTNGGENIKAGQYIFMFLYLLNLIVVFKIYYKLGKIPPFVLVFLSITGYRIHSIFVLRMFNDPVAMLFFYIAMERFLSGQYLFGSIFYSLAVSIKMNVLLFAPALFFCSLLNNGIAETVFYILISGVIQFYLGFQFLEHDWYAYLKSSFDLGRVFMYEWTVNWRFLPEEVFLDKRFHVALLIGHITVLFLFIDNMWFRNKDGLRASIRSMRCNILTKTGFSETFFTFATANLIGIAFARSLHYQFYSWYYHQLPFLLFLNYPEVRNVRDIPWTSIGTKSIVLLLVEVCWNTYPSTWWSSLMLHVIHFGILAYLVITREHKPPPQPISYNVLEQFMTLATADDIED